MSVKVFDRKRFHVYKKLFPEPSERPLVDIDHHLGLYKGCKYAQCVKGSYSCHCTKERSVVRVFSSDHGLDIGIDQGPGKKSSLNR